MALTKITSDIVESNIQQSGFKNKIIGGDFSTNPWQRGTSFVAVGANAYTADRWIYNKSTDSGIVSILKTQDAPSASQAGIFTQHCLDVDVTAADTSIASNEFSHIGQCIEGINSMPLGFGQAGARFVSLSFWHKHTKVGSYSVSFGNSDINRSYVATYTQDASNVWEKAEITIPVDTSGTWLYDNGIGLRVRFCIAAGSAYQTTPGSWVAGNFFATSSQVNGLDNVNNNFKIALVQLEYGNQASMFEARSIGQEYELCRRYYRESRNLGAAWASIEGADTSVWINATNFYDFGGKSLRGLPMRTNPTMIFYDVVSGSTSNVRNLTSPSNIPVTSLTTGTSAYIISTSAGTAGNAAAWQWSASAEL